MSSGRDMNEWSDAEGHVERAHEAFEAGRWEEAESELRRALAINPYRAEWHFNLGLTLEAAGRFDDAFSAFKDAHELEDDDPQVLMAMGLNLLRVDKAREALAFFEKVSKLDNEYMPGLVYRIEAHARLGEHEQAEVVYYLAQQINPDDAGLYAAMADSLLSRGLYDRAVWCLREAAHHDPRLPRVHARLAEAYAATGRLERARQLYLKELRQAPGDLDTLLDLGCLLVEMNRLQDASEKFRRVLEMEPDNPHAHFYLGELAEKQGLAEQAADQYRIVLRLEPDYGSARRRLAMLLVRRNQEGDAAAARDLLNEEFAAFRADPAAITPEDLDDLGRALLDAKLPAEARLVFERLLKERPNNAMALHHLGVACYQSGDRARGVEASREAVRHDPRLVPAMHNLAVASLHDRQWRRARYWVREALAVDPDDASLRRLRLRLRLQNAAESLVELVRVVTRRRL